MGKKGKMEVEVEVKSSAERFWSAIAESTELFPKALPQQFKSIRTLEGDGKSPGSLRLIQYAPGTPVVTFTKERIETMDEAGKTVSYSVVGGEMASFYSTFKATLRVAAAKKDDEEEEGALVTWAVEYEEKAPHEALDPALFTHAAAQTFRELDAYLLKN
ncbi:unnamed protein product [Spirodela intermedia]|uniref:Bet v I/Major latex protein domain-containing protein n=1 Tax=Spirodela intermedia TaxID=51605 RepID=A0A7I8LI59_SPIIN|nr:unnamed protein product [Spirodela intermedia]